MARRPQALQVARDLGGGQRGISHAHLNPYDIVTHPLEHAAWEGGWEDAECEANEIAERSLARLKKRG